MFLLKADSWQIKKTKNKGLGAFAKKAIRKGTIISDYLGKVIKTAHYDLEQGKDGLYLMYLSDQATVYPDLSKEGPHLINHSCEPNCWIYTFKGHTLFFAIRDIKENEELTISYLLSPGENCRECTHTCKCDAGSCTGTMHLPEVKYQKWQKFQENGKKNTKISKVAFGRNLPKLTSYPKIFPGNPIYTAIKALLTNP